MLHRRSGASWSASGFVRLLHNAGAADVALVVEDAGAARAVTADGGVAPEDAARAGDAVVVQATRDGLRRAAGGEFGEMRRTTAASSSLITRPPRSSPGTTS
jgi:hypothetical protein